MYKKFTCAYMHMNIMGIFMQVLSDMQIHIYVNDGECTYQGRNISLNTNMYNCMHLMYANIQARNLDSPLEFNEKRGFPTVNDLNGA